MDSQDFGPRAENSDVSPGPSWHSLVPVIGGDKAQQVRIEQRVTIRIAPTRGNGQTRLLAALHYNRVRPQFVERKAGSCVSAANIVGVQVGQGNRLILYMRDRGIFTVNLEQAGHAREF